MDLLSISSSISSSSSTLASSSPALALNELKSIISASLLDGNSVSRHSSSEAHIMPSLFTPLNLLDFIFTFSPSPCQRTKLPGSASATSISSFKLLPPHTIWLTSLFPISTIHTLSLSALGCCSTETIRPTIILSKSSLGLLTLSTSTVRMVRS